MTPPSPRQEVAAARSDSGTPVRKLLIDVSAIAHFDAGTGIQRVVRAVVLGLQGIDFADTQVCLVAADRLTSYRRLPDDWLWRGPERPSLNLPNLEKVEVASGDIFLGLDFAAATLPRHERQIAGWRAAGVRINLFVYDLLPLLRPGWFRRPMRRNFKRWLAVVERQADQVIAISSSVSKEVEAWQNRRRFTLRPRRWIDVATIHLSGQIAASAPTHGLPPDAEEILRWVRRRQTVLIVGTIEPRKGHKPALAAFEAMWRTDPEQAPQLLIVGRPGWKTQPLQTRLRSRSGTSGPLLWLDDASDEFLRQLYPLAAGVLVPSKGEGFGLPLLEALSNGRPVLVRDIPVFRELRQPGLRYFSDDQPAKLSAAILEWLAFPELPDISGARPLRTWVDVAQELLRALAIVPLRRNAVPETRGAAVA